MKNIQTSVDHTALKANQVIIIVLNISAFILNTPWIIAFDCGGDAWRDDYRETRIFTGLQLDFKALGMGKTESDPG